MKRFVAILLCLTVALSVVSAQTKTLSNKAAQSEISGSQTDGVSSIILSRDHLSSTDPDRAVTVRILGNGLDSFKALHVQLSQNGKNQSPIQCTVNNNGTEATALINVPVIQNIGASGDIITIRVIENFTTIDPLSASIKITPPATITRLSVGDYQKGDRVINVTLSGRNLDIRGETVITVTDSDGVEAAECRTVLPIPVQEVEEEPTVSLSYEIGDLVMKDGFIVALDDYNKRKMGTPMGVIAYERDGDPYMVGVASVANANNGNGMRWCSYSANGYNKVTDLQVWSDNDYVAYAEIKGHTDGSEAWSILQDMDPEHTKDRVAEDYYPAFWYAEMYGINNGLSGTKYEAGWFIPSLWELAEIYTNRDIINDAFYEFCNYDMGYRRYRSSSQNPSDSSYSPGINFDEGYIWNTYSSKDESDVYVMVVCPVSGGGDRSSNIIETSIPVPEDTGIFSVQVTIDGVLQGGSGRIQIAGEPEITRVEMPSVSVAYCGEEIPVIIYGKNFTVSGMNADKFIVFGLEASPVRIVSDTQAAVTITYPDSEGDYDVTFVCGDSIFPATLHILDSVVANWAPGDIILSDGSKIPYQNIGKMTAAQKSNAVAVVAYTKYGLIPYGMGIEQNSDINLMKEYSTGYNSLISDIISERSNSWYADDGVSITGDTSGYDNWSVVKSIDPDGAKYPADNYPGFDWAEKYGISHGLPASCSDGWFIPSLYELVEIYRNRDAINKSLQALGKNQLMRGWYSTSSQYPTDSDYVWRIDFTDGEIDSGYKDSSRYELVVRQFGSEVMDNSSNANGKVLRKN